MEPRIDWARKKALSVLEDLEIATREHLLDLEGICMKRGVAVKAERLDRLHGALIRHNRLILYNKSIPELGKQRFTIAHELGHWEMHPGLNQVFVCTAQDIQAYRGSAHEIEANAFAAELLMPSFLISDALARTGPTIATAVRLADWYQTSFTAAVLRMIQFTDLPAFVAFSVNDQLKWYQRSSRAQSYFFKRIGSELDGDSLARYCTDSIDDASEPEEVETSAWFPDDFNKHRFKIVEQSVELGDYGVTVSIITVDH